MTVAYFHTHLTPYALIIIIIIIIITLTNNQSNIIQYNFHTLSITVTLSYFVLKIQRKHFKKITWLVCDCLCTQKRLSFHPSHKKNTHWAKPVTRNSVSAACGAESSCFKGFFEVLPGFVRGFVDSCAISTSGSTTRYSDRKVAVFLSSSEFVVMSKLSPME